MNSQDQPIPTPRLKLGSEIEFDKCKLSRLGLWEVWKKEEQKARTLERELWQKEQEVETLMLRSVGTMAIAEGDEGWQKLPIECPMMDAVKILRKTFDQNFTQYNIALAKSHDQLQSLQSERDKLRKALEELVNRLEFVHQDFEYRGVWVIANLHLGDYTGATYTEALGKAKEALSKSTITINKINK